MAPHSLRAVDPGALKELVAAVPDDAPIHIHAAEQTREVEECKAALGKRPVEWLLSQMRVDERWCVVHATQVTDEETRALAASRAVAGLCPSTEGNLGDGIFPLAEYRASGGRYGIGGDSHVSRDPAEELRLLEYFQRVSARKRNVVTPCPALLPWALRYGSRPPPAARRRIGPPHGCARSWQAGRSGGAGCQASRPAGALAATRSPMRSCFRAHVGFVRDVMVAGRWVVRKNAIRRYGRPAWATKRR